MGMKNPKSKIQNPKSKIQNPKSKSKIQIMPEIRFQIEWPDGTQEVCYSPSLIVKEYFTPGEQYDLDDFLRRSQDSLTIASDRVKAKYGSPCGLALGQLQRIEASVNRAKTNATDANLSQQVKVLQFIE